MWPALCLLQERKNWDLKKRNPLHLLILHDQISFKLMQQYTGHSNTGTNRIFHLLKVQLVRPHCIQLLNFPVEVVTEFKFYVRFIPQRGRKFLVFFIGKIRFDLL